MASELCVVELGTICVSQVEQAQTVASTSMVASLWSLLLA